jgi:hypothetical protein
MRRSTKRYGSSSATALLLKNGSQVIEEFQDLEAAVQTTLVASPEAQSCESARAAKFRVP